MQIESMEAIKGLNKISHLGNPTKKQKIVISHLYCIGELKSGLVRPGFIHLEY